MKNKIYTLLWVLMACLAFSSCQEDSIDELTGKYPEPANYNLTKVVSSNRTKVNGLNRFALELSDGGSAVLKIVLVGDQYFLHAASFTPASSTAGKKGNYLTDLSSFNNDPLVSGSLKVTKTDNQYTMKGYLWMQSGNVVHVDFAGTLEYEPEINEIEMPKLLSFVSYPGASGTFNATLSVATNGVTAVSNGYGGYNYTGNGWYTNISLVSAEYPLAEGTYTPADNGAAAAGNFVKGYDTTFNWGGVDYPVPNQGTCFFTVDNNVATGSHITTGKVTVAKVGTDYKVTLEYDLVRVIYTGPLGN